MTSPIQQARISLLGFGGSSIVQYQDWLSWWSHETVLVAVTTGMRASEIFGLRWSDVMYNEGLLAVRAKLKGGKMRYVPMLPELAEELRLFMPKPAKQGNVRFIVNRDLIFPPKADAKGGRRRVE